MRILTVVGARPQFVKLAAISRAVASLNEKGPIVEEILVHTGQHYDEMMSSSFFRELNIPEPDFNLAIPGGHHGESTGQMLQAIEKVLIDCKPDIVVVYGDTNSTLAGALAAAKLHIPVAHVEAGLRSYNKRMPEEINRIVTDHISEILFCPSQSSRENLAREGIEDGVQVVGDVMCDVALWYAGESRPKLVDEEYALATIHRSENTDNADYLRNIFKGLAECGIRVVFPIHPRTRKMIEQFGLTLPQNVHAIEPLAYRDLLSALKHAAFVLTDSGGLQKEAYFYNTKCITLRNETEWVELVEAGVNVVVGTDVEKILNAVKWAHQPTVFPKSIYGDGKAAQRIVDFLVTFAQGGGL